MKVLDWVYRAEATCGTARKDGIRAHLRAKSAQMLLNLPAILFHVCNRKIMSVAISRPLILEL